MLSINKLSINKKSKKDIKKKAKLFREFGFVCCECFPIT